MVPLGVRFDLNLNDAAKLITNFQDTKRRKLFEVSRSLSGERKFIISDGYSESRYGNCFVIATVESIQYRTRADIIVTLYIDYCPQESQNDLINDLLYTCFVDARENEYFKLSICWNQDKPKRTAFELPGYSKYYDTTKTFSEKPYIVWNYNREQMKLFQTLLWPRYSGFTFRSDILQTSRRMTKQHITDTGLAQYSVVADNIVRGSQTKLTVNIYIYDVREPLAPDSGSPLHQPPESNLRMLIYDILFCCTKNTETIKELVLSICTKEFCFAGDLSCFEIEPTMGASRTYDGSDWYVRTFDNNNMQQIRRILELT